MFVKDKLLRINFNENLLNAEINTFDMWVFQKALKTQQERTVITCNTHSS